jgi:hypothetical protein
MTLLSYDVRKFTEVVFEFCVTDREGREGQQQSNAIECAISVFKM